LCYDGGNVDELGVVAISRVCGWPWWKFCALVLAVCVVAVSVFGFGGGWAGLPGALTGAGSLAVGVAQAQGWESGLFTDVGGHWAEKYIAQAAIKGVVKGYGGGKFEPGQAVSRFECLAMLVRVLGLETEVQRAGSIPSSFRHPELVPDWARGYVALGVQRGIIAGTDLTDFRGNEQASRLEVAVLSVRALGLGDEAERMTSPWLNYTDAYRVPAWARGYLAVAAREEIMRGLPDGSFNPDGKVTRAEMAAIVARLDDRLQNSLDSGEIWGTLAVLSVSTAQSISVTLADQSVRTVPVAPGCMAYRDGTRVSLAQLIVGDPVRAIVDATGKAVYIDNARASQAVLPITVSAKLVAVVTGDTPLVTVEDARGNRQTYSVSTSCQVERDGKQASLSALRPGDALELTLRGNTVVSIKAEAQDYEVEGVFVRLEFTNPPAIVVKVDGKEESHTLDPDASVVRNSKTSTLGSLRAGDEVTLVVRGGEVTKITAQAVEESATGTVQSVTIGETSRITIRTTDGQEKTYPISAGVVIRKDRTRIGLADIRPGSYVDMEIESGEVTRMDVEPYTILDDVRGIVEYVVESADVIVISVLPPGSSSSSGTREIHVTARTLFVRGEHVIDLNDIDPGDRIIAVGSTATGIFVAQTIVVLTIND